MAGAPHQGSGYLPPIDSKHLRRNGEAILNSDIRRNGEAIVTGGRGSQATLEQRLNSRASTGNDRYAQMDPHNEGGYQRKYLDLHHAPNAPLPPRPKYNSIQQPVGGAKPYLHHAKQGGYRY
jgi:hypothetical protein